jgi:hypothetical protein
MTARWVLRGRVVQVLAAFTASIGAVLAACIIADPPTDLPRPTPRKPTIIRSTAVPPDTRVLGTFPDPTQGQGFHVEVEVDPSAPKGLTWRLYLDYVPVTLDSTQIGTGDIPLDPTSAHPEIREVDMIPGPSTRSDLTRCHVFEGIVSFPPAGGGTSTHDYDPELGDSITWFYSPTGDVSGCPVFNSGLDGSFRDVQADNGLAIGDGGLE